MLLIFIKEVGDGEVVEFQTDATDDTRLSPTERKLDLVVRFLFEIPVDVNRSVFVIGFNFHSLVQFFGIEMSRCSDFTRRAHQCLTRKQVAGLRAQFATNHVFVESVVTIDSHAVDVGLRTFPNAHFEVDGVAFGLDFYWFQPMEEITIVPIEGSDGIVVVREAFSQQFLVIDIAFFHIENIAQSWNIAHSVSRINRVSDPRNVTQVVFRALIDLHIHVHVLRIDRPHAVFDNDGIAETQFVVFLDEFFLVFLPTVGRELLGFQETAEFTSLVGLRQCTFAQKTTLDFLVAELVVAFDDDAAHLHLLFFVDDDVENHVVFLRHVVALHHRDFGILKAFFVEIFLGNQFRTVEHIRVDAHSRRHSEALFQFLFFRLFHADVVDFRHARTTGQRHVQVDAIAHDGIG